MASIWGELKRRNVIKVAAAYAVVGWLLLQLTDVLISLLNLPDWLGQVSFFFILIGFPLALVLAWAFELTPEGLKREKDVDPATRAASTTGQKLNYTIIVLLAAAVIVLAVDDFVLVDNATEAGGPRNSIAVLPFSNESAAEENAEFFANGIHDEVLTQLSRIRALKVISRTSVMEYRDTTKNLREIGAELGVATILEGRVQRAGDRLRINVQLIDTASDEHLWADIYDRQLTAEDIFAIQTEMAIAIADALKATLTPTEVARLNERPTQSTRAYDFYLSGLQYLQDSDRLTRTPLAILQFERAIAEDPAFALAYARLSQAHSVMYFYGYDRMELRLASVLETVQQAIALNPDLPEAHLAMAYYYYRGTKNWDEALKELAIAERGMPNDPEIGWLRALTLRRAGQWQASLDEMAGIVELDPGNLEQLLTSAAQTHMALRDYAEAERAINRVLEIRPDWVGALTLRLRLEVCRDGDVSRSRAYADDPANPDPDKYLWGWLAAVYERDTELALRYLDNWEGDVDQYAGRVYKPRSLYYGQTYALAGQPELALQHFRMAQTLLDAALQADPGDYRVYAALAAALAGLGDREGSIHAAGQAVTLMSPAVDALDGQHLQARLIVEVYAAMEDADRLVQALDDYLGQPGQWSIEGMLPDPRLDFVRDDPRFQALIEKYGRQ